MALQGDRDRCPRAGLWEGRGLVVRVRHTARWEVGPQGPGCVVPDCHVQGCQGKARTPLLLTTHVSSNWEPEWLPFSEVQETTIPRFPPNPRVPVFAQQHPGSCRPWCELLTWLGSSPCCLCPGELVSTAAQPRMNGGGRHTGTHPLLHLSTENIH